VHAIKERQPKGGCEAANGSCTTVLLFTLWPRVRSPQCIT